MNKKYAALFTASVLLLTSLSAAENFPTSQFDHDGWYRPNGTVCPAQDAVATPRPTATPASAPVKRLHLPRGMIILHHRRKCKRKFC